MGHHPTTFPLMQNYQSIAKNLFCNFCKFVGHDEKDFRTLDLMRKCITDAYIVQWEEGPKGGITQYNTLRRYRGGFKGQRRGGFGRGKGPIICYNCNQTGHLVRLSESIYNMYILYTVGSCDGRKSKFD
jgi:hypothetical protein